MATKSAMALRNATDLAKRLGVGIKLVEEITRCLEPSSPVARSLGSGATCRPPDFGGSSTPSSVPAGTTIFGFAASLFSSLASAGSPAASPEAESVAVNDHVNEVRLTVTDCIVGIGRPLRAK
jgi:hypothetical protein